MNNEERLCQTAIDLGAHQSAWNAAGSTHHVTTYWGVAFWYHPVLRKLYTTAGRDVNRRLLVEGMRAAVQVAYTQGYNIRNEYWRVFGGPAPRPDEATEATQPQDTPRCTERPFGRDNIRLGRYGQWDLYINLRWNRVGRVGENSVLRYYLAALAGEARYASDLSFDEAIRRAAARGLMTDPVQPRFMGCVPGDSLFLGPYRDADLWYRSGACAVCVHWDPQAPLTKPEVEAAKSEAQRRARARGLTLKDDETAVAAVATPPVPEPALPQHDAHVRRRPLECERGTGIGGLVLPDPRPALEVRVLLEDLLADDV